MEELVMSSVINSLCETANVLIEAAARDQRKEIVSSVKNLAKTEKAKLFLSGKLDNDAAKKFYATAINEIQKLRTAIDSVPPETTAEKVLGIFTTIDIQLEIVILFAHIGQAIWANYEYNECKAILKYVNRIIKNEAWIDFVTGLIGVATAVKKGTTSKGELNFNKAAAERVVNKIENKIETVYNKYYKE